MINYKLVVFNVNCFVLGNNEALINDFIYKTILVYLWLSEILSLRLSVANLIKPIFGVLYILINYVHEFVDRFKNHLLFFNLKVFVIYLCGLESIKFLKCFNEFKAI